MEQSVNQILALKQFLLALKSTHEALEGARTNLMTSIREASIAQSC